MEGSQVEAESLERATKKKKDATKKTKTNKEEAEKKFSSTETENLISAWAKEEVLFNCKHSEYFNKDQRAAAMQRVLLTVDKEGLTIAELQKKMACLRTYYGKESGKEKASKVSGTGAKKVYVSKWPLYSSLHFLKDNITPRKTSSTMSPLEAEDGVDCQPNQSNSSPDENTDDMKPIFITNNPPTSMKSKRKLQMSLEEELLSSCIQELKKPKNEEKIDDADASFGQYVVNQLHNIPNGYHKEMLKLEIQQLIIKLMIPTPAVNSSRQPFTTINFDDFQ